MKKSSNPDVKDLANEVNNKDSAEESNKIES
jgi:hypothetical protein